MSTHAKILIADDDDEIRILLKTLLGKNGFEVIEADNGQQALKLANSRDPQIILLDVEMPEMNGYEVCKKITTDGSSFTGKILMLSGHKKSREQIAGLDCGALDYIIKPFDEKVLIAKIHAVLRETEKRELQDQGEFIEKGVFKLCNITRTLWLNGRKTAVLTETEFNIMKLFLKKSPECVTRTQVFADVFENHSDSLQIVDVHLYNLRKKLGRTKFRLVSCYGRGFRLLT